MIKKYLNNYHQFFVKHNKYFLQSLVFLQFTLRPNVQKIGTEYNNDNNENVTIQVPLGVLEKISEKNIQYPKHNFRIKID